jgi:hypothetical protein
MKVLKTTLLFVGILIASNVSAQIVVFVSKNEENYHK